MSHLPVIVGFGGYSAAGRSSSHHAFRRTVIESLPPAERQQTLASLAVLMQLVQVENEQYVDESGNTLTLADITGVGAEHADDAAAFTSRRQAAFAAERERWAARP